MTKVAAAQMCSSMDVDKNLMDAVAAIRNAARNQAKLIVLPEMFAILGKDAADTLSKKEPFKTGRIQSILASEARTNAIWIVAGTLPIECDDPGKMRAASIVFNDKGEVVARYDKIHLFDVVLSATEQYKESDSAEPGASPVVVETPFGKLGLAVCYDIRFPELFRFYATKQVDMIIIPAAFTVKTGPHWDKLVQARAIENFCYVIGACQGGEHANGRKTYGNSVIVDPWGDIVSKLLGEKPGIIYGEINLDYLHQIRESVPALSHRKIR